MIPRLLDRWRRRLDLDQVRPRRGMLAEHVDRVFQFISAGDSGRPIELLLRYLLLEALLDSALGLHFFDDEDDGCLRMCAVGPFRRT